MNFEPEDIARLLVAVMLLLVWSVRRLERANLCWGFAYLLISLGAAGSNAAKSLLWSRLDLIAACGLGAWLLWLGANAFLQRRTKWLPVALLAVCWLIAMFAAAIILPSLFVWLVALPLLVATLHAAYSVDTFGRAYRVTAVVTALCALLLFVSQVLFPESRGLHWTTALGYVCLTLAAAHVTVGRFQTRLQAVINTDALTGLANHVGFVEGMKGLLGATSNDPIHIAVICIDIENFRGINEAIGTRSGNQLLCEVGRRLRHAAQRVYLVARDEGDRFLVLLSGTSVATLSKSAEDTAAQIRGAMAKPVALGENSIALRVRIGADLAFGPNADIETLIQHATVASGRKRDVLDSGLSFYNADMNQQALRKLDLEHGLRNALTNGELWLAYQPIVDSDSGKVLSLEALLRWTSAQLGVIDPVETIPAAEECGLIIELGEWVLKETAAQIGRWQEQQQAVPVSVNVSAHQLSQPQFAHRVLEILETAGVAAALLEIELTESVLLGDDRAVMDNINALHAAGVGLALDDFGTGFSSLSYLTRLPLKTLKIDKTFVHQLDRDQRSRRLTETICAIGHQLDLELTAEGIETSAQAVMLRSFGVKRMQGFYFARPKAAAEVSLGVVKPLETLPPAA